MLCIVYGIVYGMVWYMCMAVNGRYEKAMDPQRTRSK